MTTTERLRELERAATPGPWYAYSPLASGVHAGHCHRIANSKPEGIVQEEDGTWVPDFPDWNENSRIILRTTDDEKSRDNSRLIAATRNALPAMLDVIETAEEVERVWHKNIHVINSELDLKVAELLLKLAAFREVGE